jgi:hypothetical protein
LMNSPFVIQLAKGLTDRADFKAAATDEQRIQLLYQLAFQRDPSKEEIKWAAQFTNTSPASSDFTSWQKYAQVLLLTDELVFVD